MVMTGFRVTPVVAFVRPGFELRLDSREVEDTFEVPLDYVFDPANHRLRLRRSGFTGEDVRVQATSPSASATSGVRPPACC